MCDLVYTMFSLAQAGFTLLAVWMATDPWEAARRLYLVVQYLRLGYELVKKLRGKRQK